jgi:hypothetical protein
MKTKLTSQSTALDVLTWLDEKSDELSRSKEYNDNHTRHESFSRVISAIRLELRANDPPPPPRADEEDVDVDDLDVNGAPGEAP